MKITIQKEFFRNPHVDWITILLLTLALAVFLAFAGFNLYNAVMDGTLKGTNTSKTSFTQIDEKSITTVLTKYTERENESAKFQAGYTGAPDPSIQNMPL